MKQMKDSGIEWIEQIPEDWTTKRIKELFTEINDRCEYGGNYTLLSVSEYYGVAPRADKVPEDEMITHADSLDGYKICLPNDIVMNIMLAWKRALGVSNFTGIVSPAYCVYRSKIDMIARYFHYLFRTDIYANLFKQYSTGIIDSRLRLYPDKFLSLTCHFPNKETQKRIADFLDEKCDKIDRYIEKQQQVIEKLKAYKQSVITEAVTKGINPDVPMKDSGIEWIGMIPEHWGVAKLANLFTFLGGYAFNSDLYVPETENLIVRIGNVKNDRLLFDANPVYISDDLSEQVIKFKLQCGDILFTMTGTKGKRDYFYTLILDDSHIQTKNLYLNQRVGCFRKKAHIHAEYYNYLLKDNRILDSIFLYETGTANQGNLGIDSINRTKVHLPPYDEQIIIANYLKDKCSRIDAVIAKKEVAINKSTEYKKSLIYEAVTGKLEV